MVKVLLIKNCGIHYIANKELSVTKMVEKTGITVPPIEQNTQTFYQPQFMPRHIKWL